MWQQSLDHPSEDSFWQSKSTRRQLDRVNIPVLLFGGWYDNFVESDLLSALPTDACFDIVVSNPPYVSRAELDRLSPALSIG